ncbi:flagellar hook-associated protein FlgK [Clostridium sp.]|uniref:flagellar hook-associated protein FlgK n=1 Tax=Clostridium sp. TaxID=1506 RepID=UPI00346439A9
MSGLFNTFNIAKRGMGVQQKALDVTSHNISNANTPGYSRQRAEIETSRPFGMPSLNSVTEPGQLGTGAQISAINRIRDTFTDYLYRNESSTYGNFEQRYNFLTQVEGIFTEPSDTGISSLMGKFFDAWQEVSKQPSSSRARTVLVEQTKALTNALNHASNQLEKLTDNAQSLLKDNVFEVNNLLDQVNQLNKEIRSVKVAGNTPNDLMDKRDLLLDELSLKFNINVDRKNLETIELKPTDGGDFALVRPTDGESYNRLSYISGVEKQTDGKIKVTYYALGNMNSQDNKKELTIEPGTMKDDEIDAKIKELEETRVIFGNEKGEAIGPGGKVISGSQPITFDDLQLFKPSSGGFKGIMSIQEDVNKYKGELDRLAKAMAFAVNTIHSGTDIAGDDDLPFFVNGDDESKEHEITAGNIKVNDEISKDPMKIKVKKDDSSGESDGSRALAIAQLRDTLLKVQDINNQTTRQLFIDGRLNPDGGMGIENDVSGMKIDGYFKDTINRLGVQCQEAKRMVKNQLTLLDGHNESRGSVSGVSLDEEMANLIQFQHAYSANAKIVSTVDELLDVVINGLKR